MFHDTGWPCGRSVASREAERRRAFEPEDIAEELTGEIGERAPVGAELELHRNAADDAHGKIQQQQRALEARMGEFGTGGVRRVQPVSSL